MKSSLFPRVLFLILVALLLLAGAVLAWFQSWRSGRRIELLTGSEMATVAAGPMEYTTRGDGPVVLVFHDALGGYDQGLALAGFLAEQGFQLVIPSRPGYLRTPLATGLTPENQADAAAQLLDTLEIGQVSVIGFGWGGPAALEFARRFPQRTSALVFAGAAVSQQNPPLAPAVYFPQAVAEGLGGDVGAWLYVQLSEKAPAHALQSAFALTSTGGKVQRSAWTDIVLGAPEQLEHFRELALSLAPMDPRESGLRNDLLQIRALPNMPFKEITTPLLILHGGLDKAVPIAPIEAAHTQLPHSELLFLPDEGHLLFLGRSAEIAQARMISFLKKHTSAASHAE